MITQSESVLIDRIKINGSLARVAIQHLKHEVSTNTPHPLNPVNHYSAYLMQSFYSPSHRCYWVEQ
jgi:hypothetical protein